MLGLFVFCKINEAKGIKHLKDHALGENCSQSSPATNQATYLIKPKFWLKVHN